MILSYPFVSWSFLHEKYTQSQQPNSFMTVICISICFDSSFLFIFFFLLSFFLFYFAALQFLLPAEKKLVCSWQPEFFFPSLSSWLWFLVYLPCFLLFLAAFLLSPLFIWSPLLSKPPLFPAYDFGYDWCLSHIK